MLSARRAVVQSKASAEDLRYLLGKATSLGGVRPKCSILDDDGPWASFRACEMVDAMRSKCLAFKQDVQQLWRRMVFNHLVTHVDDQLHNIGFLYIDAQLWCLAPTFEHSELQRAHALI